MLPEFRKDPVVNRWVIIATDRANRPKQHRPETTGRDDARCTFCAGNESLTPPEIIAYRENSGPDEPGWKLRVVPNRYPALVPVSDCRLRLAGQDLYTSMHGCGTHEVVIETPLHVTNIANLDENQISDMLRAYRDRTVELGKDKRWRQILIYKNQGWEAGATFEHVHSQIIALPLVPREITDELHGARKYYRERGRCIYCDMVGSEIRDRSRIVSESESFLALCPYAARFSFELWLLPKRHSAHFEQLSNLEHTDLARTVKQVHVGLDRCLNGLVFNYVLHTAPLHRQAPHYHWHLEIMPRLTGIAGFEFGSGFFINPVAPEDSARELRDALR